VIFYDVCDHYCIEGIERIDTDKVREKTEESDLDDSFLLQPTVVDGLVVEAEDDE